MKENLEKIAEFHQSIDQQTVNMIFAEWDRIYLLGKVEKSLDYPMLSVPNPILETSFLRGRSYKRDCEGLERA